ncbi:hypothetical protein B0H19DRAFT_1262779 [Mycena capillaripes]|nr:hypothetical protein B0H19DRAFT_1262779 [Mycena capillaripes]
MSPTSYASMPTYSHIDGGLPSAFSALPPAFSVYKCNAQRWPRTVCEPTLLPLVHAWYASIYCVTLLLLPRPRISNLKLAHRSTLTCYTRGSRRPSGALLQLGAAPHLSSNPPIFNVH